MFGGFVSAYLHFVRSKVDTCCVVEWGRERFQAGSGQVSHELSFSFASISRQSMHRNFTDLAKS